METLSFMGWNSLDLAPLSFKHCCSTAPVPCKCRTLMLREGQRVYEPFLQAFTDPHSMVLIGLYYLSLIGWPSTVYVCMTGLLCRAYLWQATGTATLLLLPLAPPGGAMPFSVQQMIPFPSRCVYTSSPHK